MRTAKVTKEEIEKIKEKILELLKLLKDCGAEVKIEDFDLRFVDEFFFNLEERNSELLEKLGIDLVGLGHDIYHCIVNYWGYFVPPEEVLKELDETLDVLKSVNKSD